MLSRGDLRSAGRRAYGVSRAVPRPWGVQGSEAEGTCLGTPLACLGQSGEANTGDGDARRVGRSLCDRPGIPVLSFLSITAILLPAVEAFIEPDRARTDMDDA